MLFHRFIVSSSFRHLLNHSDFTCWRAEGRSWPWFLQFWKGKASGNHPHFWLQVSRWNMITYPHPDPMERFMLDDLGNLQNIIHSFAPDYTRFIPIFTRTTIAWLYPLKPHLHRVICLSKLSWRGFASPTILWTHHIVLYCINHTKNFESLYQPLY